MFVKCDCQHCGGGIEFDEKDDKRLCDCPHCGKEMILMVPPAKLYQQPPMPVPPIAKQFPIKKMNQDTAGGCFFSLLGAVLLIGGLYGLVVNPFWGVPAIIVSLIICASSWSLSNKFVCTNCGNRVDGEQVKLCPTCKVVLYQKGWW